MNIKSLPELDRPREKARHYGINKLSNIELLALIIGSGSKDNNVLNIASNLLATAKSIEQILAYSLNDLLLINGIKEATAFRFLAISELLKRKGELNSEDHFINSKELANRYRYIIGNNKQESMYLIAISIKGKLIFEKELYKGTSSNLISSEEEIIKELLDSKAKFFILVHNHPSSSVLPSEDDVLSTNHLLVRAKKHNLIMLDSIIVTSSSSFYSFKDEDELLD